MGFGQNGVIGHSVLSLVVVDLRNGQEHANLLSIMAGGARAIALKGKRVTINTVLVSQNLTKSQHSLLHYLLVDGYWAPWSNWTECSVTCEGGTQKRRRQCIPPKHNGKPCEGDNNEVRVCNTQRCPS